MNNLYTQLSNKYNYKTINYIINNIDSSYKNKYINKDEYIFLKHQLNIFPINYINYIFKILILNSKQKNKKILVSTIIPLKQINNDFCLNEMVGGIVPQASPLLTPAEINRAYQNKLYSQNTPYIFQQFPNQHYDPYIYQPRLPHGYPQPQMSAYGYPQPQMPAYGYPQPQMPAYGYPQPQTQPHKQLQRYPQMPLRNNLPHNLSYFLSQLSTLEKRGDKNNMEIMNIMDKIQGLIKELKRLKKTNHEMENQKNKTKLNN